MCKMREDPKVWRKSYMEIADRVIESDKYSETLAYWKTVKATLEMAIRVEEGTETKENAKAWLMTELKRVNMALKSCWDADKRACWDSERVALEEALNRGHVPWPWEEEE